MSKESKRIAAAKKAEKGIEDLKKASKSTAPATTKWSAPKTSGTPTSHFTDARNVGVKFKKAYPNTSSARFMMDAMRHHVMRLHTGPFYNSVNVIFEVNRYNQVFPAIFDYITGVMVMGGSSAWTSTLGGGGSNAITKVQWPISGLSIGEIAQGYITRTVQLTWLSGYVKEFTLSCSINGDKLQSVPWKASFDPLYRQYAQDCTSDGNYVNGSQYKYENALYHGQPINPLTDRLSLFVEAKFLQNPLGLDHTEAVFLADPALDFFSRISLTSNPSYDSSFASFAINSNPETWTPSDSTLAAQVVRFTTKPFTTYHKLFTPTGAQYDDGIAVVSANSSAWHVDAMCSPDPWGVATTMGGNEIYTWQSLFDVEILRVQASMFTQSIMYGHNLTPCVIVTGDPEYSVCLDATSSDWYFTTCIDCDGNIIPPLDCDGTNPAIFTDGQCCATPCTLDLSSQTVDATFGNNDGEIHWDLANPLGSGSFTGSPWASGSMYTVTLVTVPALSATIPTLPPAGGATFTATVTTNTTSGTEHQVAISSNNQIAPGMQISVPANTQIPAGTYVGPIVTGAINNAVTVFELVDNIGGSVNALAIGTPTATISAGFTGSLGTLEVSDGMGFMYELTIVDDDGCTMTDMFAIKSASVPEGCIDSAAINTVDPAVSGMIDDGSCFYCNINGDGQLTDSTGGISEELYDNNTISTLDASSNTATDGTIGATFQMNNAAAWYIELDGTQSYTMVLYSLSVPGDITTITATVATQAGLAATVFTDSPFHTFTSLGFGYYAIKIFLVDNDEVHGLETCYTYAFANIKAPGCNDVTANNYYTTLTPAIPADLLIPDNSLCTFPVVCCTLSAITEDSTTLGTICSPYLAIVITCDPTALLVTATWHYDDGSGSVFITGSNLTVGTVSSGTPQTVYLQDSSGGNLIQGNGVYYMHITVLYATGDTCNVASALYNYEAVICDCTDPTAINFNPLATIDDGSCIYPSWDCVSPGVCTDPGTGAGAWNSTNGGYSACMASCLPVIPGCTDPCAFNYDATATIDDGTCTYAACLDSFAYNQYWSCSCFSNVPTATVSNPTCCLYCNTNPPTTSPTITDASGTCASPLADGIYSDVIILNNTATTYGITYFLGGTTTVYYLDPVLHNSGDTISYNGFLPGTYTASIVDNFGCTYLWNFAVGVDVPNAGCTDPGASNYDATAVCDDGSCLSSGCTDPLAVNYDASATTDDGSCEYQVISTPCITPHMDDRLNEINICLSAKGSEWLAAYRIGTNADCTLINKWKLILVQYLLQQKGLGCLYNCADESTPDASSLEACADLAILGGPVTGVNDQGYIGSSHTTGGSTIITAPLLYFTAGNILYAGDIITMPSGLIWKVIPPVISCTSGCINPETGPGAASGHWKQCIPLNDISITTNINYIDNFLNFANKFCQDCNIDLL